MATKKTAGETDEVKVDETEAKEMVKLKLPIIPGRRDLATVTVVHNLINYQIKRGVTVEVPSYVAKVIEYAEEQQLKAAKLVEENSIS